MSNCVTVSVEFYFKGEKLSASIKLDLDRHMQTIDKFPDLYPLLARAINLNLYSYEYEMMQTETIIFSQAEGIAAEHINNGILDIEAFEAAWTENQLHEKLQLIARQYLSVDDINQQPELKNALLEAYRLGKQ